MAPVACPDVAYTALASSQLAFHIMVTGTDCETAMAVALGAREDDNGLPFDVDGFHCVKTSTSPPSGIFYYHFVCTGSSVMVTFDAQPVAVPPRPPTG